MKNVFVFLCLATFMAAYRYLIFCMEAPMFSFKQYVGFSLSLGQDSGKVVIWNMAPVLKEDDEKNENVPKMLCQMDNHLGTVEWISVLLCWGYQNC